jgi:hypothetical protein
VPGERLNFVVAVAPTALGVPGRMFETKFVEGMPPLARLSDVTALSEQRRFLVERPSPQPQAAEPVSDTSETVAHDRWWDVRLPSLRPLKRTAREERARERESERESAYAEAAKEAFFATPAGRARLAYKRGHQLFQYELEVNGLSPTIIPGPVGSPPRETTDPVDILNSVTVEGWKLVTGKFLHSEVRNGAVGVYLFKRSQKRRLAMNNPW